MEEKNNNDINTEINLSEQYSEQILSNNNNDKEKTKELELYGSLKSANIESYDSIDNTSFLSKLSNNGEKKRKMEMKEELKRKKGNPNMENMSDNDKSSTNKDDGKENNEMINREIRKVEESKNKEETIKINKEELINNIINKEDVLKDNICKVEAIKNKRNENEIIENNKNEESIISNEVNKKEEIKNNIKKDENIKKTSQDYVNERVKDYISEKRNCKETENDREKIEYSQSDIDKKEKTGNLKYFIDYNKKYRNKNNVAFSMKYKDSCVSLSSDKLTCFGDKGWSSVFVNSGADVGKWYYEIKIEEPIQNLNFLGYKDKVIKVNSYIRVGFACRYMRYDYPIGTDKYSYCVNSKNGKIFNNSISYNCMEPLKVGDVIGCYLNLKNKNTYKFDPRSDKKLYEYLQNGILCDPKNPPALKKNYGSSIFFSLNGQIKKNSFADIYEGFYHPSVSLYMGACAKINLGPHFTYNYLKDYSPCMFMEPPHIL